MARPTVPPTGVEKFFDEDEIIVSKTDLSGKITYANEVFQRVAGFSEEELLGQPHNLIRHPAMPRCVFKFLWDTIQQGEEVFAYVVNQCRNGDHYWVFAHVTPTFDADMNITGYHSSRRVPDRAAVDKIAPIYESLLAEEERHDSPRAGMDAALKMLVGLLEQNEVEYGEFVFSL